MNTNMQICGLSKTRHNKQLAIVTDGRSTASEDDMTLAHVGLLFVKTGDMMEVKTGRILSIAPIKIGEIVEVEVDDHGNNPLSVALKQTDLRRLDDEIKTSTKLALETARIIVNERFDLEAFNYSEVY